MNENETNNERTRAVYAVPGKNIRIGGGRRPGILVSASGRTPGKILESVIELAENKLITGIEVRLDYLGNAAAEGTADEWRSMLSAAYAAAGGKLLIATIRTKAEGGETAYTDEEYGKILEAVAPDANYDLLDIEAMRDEAVVGRIVNLVHGAGRGVIMSYHNFEKTPGVSEMTMMLERERMLGGDVLKIAVMPANAEDVANLLVATAREAALGKNPLVTMAMGKLGSVTRVTGGVFGSALTFAMTGVASAPGQMTVETASGIMELLDS